MGNSAKSVVAVVAGIGAMMVWSSRPVDAANSIVTVDSRRDIDSTTSVALDASGNPVISYYDATHGDLMIAHCNDASCAGDDESITTPDHPGNVGKSSSLQLDAAGNPVVSYRDETTFDLKLVHCNDPNCAGDNDVVVVLDHDGTASVGQDTALALDAAGHPVIAYYHATNADLRVAHCNDAGCVGGNESIVTVASTSWVGLDPSLELDATGNPVISYGDLSNRGELKLAHCDDPNCAGGNETIAAVDSNGTLGGFSSLELDAAGNPVISYYGDSNGDLKLAHCNDPNCTGADESIVGVDRFRTVGAMTSLELDAVGNPVVGYLDAWNGDLKIAHCNDADCAGDDESMVTVDSAGNVGFDASLVLDAAGDPVVSYRDDGNKDLKLVHCDNAICAPVSCNGIGATIVGTANDDVIDGTAGVDVIFGGDGDDVINGLDGDDIVCGGKGADTIAAGSGDDRSFGEEGADTVDGGEGSDVINGGAGRDQLRGGPDDDQLTGGSDADGLLGGPGDDHADGGDADDGIVGGDGDDVLAGSLGNDVVEGDDGNDVLAGGAQNDLLAGGRGMDTADYSASPLAVTADLSAGTVDGEGDDALHGIEGVVGSRFDDVLAGDARDNVIWSGDGFDRLDGADGADVIDGGPAGDTIHGGSGDDEIAGGLDPDDLFGGPGNDRLDGGHSADSLAGEDGDDVLAGGDDGDVVVGGLGSDVLIGGSGDDGLIGGDGVDTADFSASPAEVEVDLADQSAVGDGSDVVREVENAVGSSSEDVLIGDDGSNGLSGGPGFDRLEGGAGDDQIAGGTGPDDVFGGAGNDHLDGGDGADTVGGLDGDDVLVGAAGDDVLNGGAGHDGASYAESTAAVTVDLTAGSAVGDGTDTVHSVEDVLGSSLGDALTGDAGANSIDGGPGDDVVAGSGGDDLLAGSAGVDTASYASAAGPVSASLTTNTVSGDGDDDLTGVENLVGSGFDDVLSGDAGVNAIDGGAGGDWLRGLGGDDALDGGPGADTVSFAASPGPVTADLDGTAVGEGADRLARFENLVGSSFSDALTGDAGANSILGGNGNDTLAGGGGNDTVNGGAGVDTATFAGAAHGVTVSLTAGTAVGDGADGLIGLENVVGSRFADVLTGNADANTLRGGIGDDRLAGVAGNDTLDGGAGVDTVSFAAASKAVTVSLVAGSAGGDGADRLAGVENLIGSSFADRLGGSAGVNTLWGGGGNDGLFAEGGNDVIDGGAGNDMVDGGSGRDRLSGRSGNDTLTGRSGNDALDGGADFDRGDGGTGLDTQTRCEMTVNVP
jgi:Ca2+-binding RTX toxin-like protein